MFITIFTPTYNRARLLPILFNSLTHQTKDCFEWVIVDDGSVDNTEQTVADFIKEQKIVIRYFKQKNGGKHRAINKGLKVARGELFYIVDSDDYLLNDAIETIIKEYKFIQDNNSYAGISGLCFFKKGSLIGSGLPQLQIDCNALDIRFKYHVTGDLAEVFKTQILRQFPFPENDNEKFCPEALVWNRVAQKYMLRYFNEPLYIRDYQQGGLTSNIIKIRMNSPIASTTYYAELLSYKIPFIQQVKAAINYWRFYFCLPHKKIVIPLLWTWCLPLGALMHLRDLQLTKQ